MGREGHDPTVVHSSIALLQERFRQLQRAKKLREERELLKMLTEPKQFNSNSTTTCEPARLLFHPELVIPSRSPDSLPPHVALTLWPTSQGKEEDHRGVKVPVSMNLRLTDYTHTHSAQGSWKNIHNCDDSDSDSGVDTSLHL